MGHYVPTFLGEPLCEINAARQVCWKHQMYLLFSLEIRDIRCAATRITSKPTKARMGHIAVCAAPAILLQEVR